MADDNLRQDLVDQVREEQQKRKHAPRVHRLPQVIAAAGETPPATDSDAVGASPEGAGGDTVAPRKRRRRRRPGGAPGGGASDGGSVANS
jgi:poly(A) polymerase